MRDAYKILVGRREGKSVFGRPWGGGKELRCEDLNLICVTQHGVQSRPVVVAEMGGWGVLISQMAVRLSDRILTHGVGCHNCNTCTFI
jgi:hypothetical protein